MRKHLLEYDDVLNKQRGAVYKRRTEFLEIMDKEVLAGVIADAAIAYFAVAFAPGFRENFEAGSAMEEVRRAFKEAAIVDDVEALETEDDFMQAIRKKSIAVAGHALAKNHIIGILDMLWMTNLEDLEALQESVGLRAYAQRDPLVEYRHEASGLFKSFWGNFNAWIFNNMFKLAQNAAEGDVTGARGANSSVNPNSNIFAAASTNEAGAGKKIGRNDPCPCGSRKKWKKCGLLNTEEHQNNIANGGAKHEVTGG
jgi:preprotein translocase subunit SecA